MTKIYLPRETTALSLHVEEVILAIRKEATKHDLELQIIRNGSRGAAWLEPLLEIEYEGKRIAYGPIRAADINSLFKADFLHAGEHELKLGAIDDIPWFKQQQRLTFKRSGNTEALSIDDYRKFNGFAGLEKALKSDKQEIIQTVLDSGLRGRGGAAFPTGIKWQTVADADADCKYIVCNADEGDSGTFSDRLLMEGDPYCLIEGMLIAGIAVGAELGFIYLRSEYPLTKLILEEALIKAREAGYLGNKIQGSDYNFDIRLHIGAGAYICGEETSLLESLEGKRGQVRFKPPLPALEGLYGKPTVVNNVITFASVPLILSKGADYYANFGQGKSLGTMPFQLSGNIKHGGLVELPFGLTLRELIEDFGGGTYSGKPIGAVQVGGPLGAYFSGDQLDTSLDYESFSAAGGMLGHGGIVVFDETVDLLKQARFAMEFCAIESCGKCTPCRIGSVRGVEVIDQILDAQDPSDTGHHYELLEDLCATLEDASLCAMGGLTPMPVRSAVKLHQLSTSTVNYREEADQ
ncbi:MAG: formate dehydrogenase [SAR86 cluster bacterium]|uniref:NADH-quinone oxidoreductase subunit F n=1 Tax=SAR86 cluster bacterium TaxID=2030880 RepID=A0A2A5CCA7_9GAMM|nr:MAG: formate dehydrogenase [SAR86 cluster bacterium]